MAIDYRWMSEGGFLLDGQGDIALTTNLETVVSMVRSRLKAAVDGWKLYRIGAGLDRYPGNTSDAEMEMTLQRQVTSAISSGFLPPSVFKVTTLRFGGEIQIYVYLNQEIIATASVSFTSGNTNTVA